MTEADNALDLCTITFRPRGNKIAVTGGKTIKDAITEGGIDFDFPCGGKGTCGKCRVTILDEVIPPTQREKKFLSDGEISQGIHLACATEIRHNLTVLLTTPGNRSHRILHSSRQAGFAVDPLITKKYVELSPPSLADQRSDWRRLREALAGSGGSAEQLKADLPILRELPELMREADYRFTVLMAGQEVLAIEKFDTRDILLGVAFDIGTTTIVGYLLDLLSGKEIAVASSLNPQVKYGADVVSRIAAANGSKKDLQDLQAILVREMDRLLGELAGKAGVEHKDIYAVTVVGNTCMHHLFLGISPKYTTIIPFVPVVSDALVAKALDFPLKINPAGRVFTLPNISGFVGADAVAVALAEGMDRSRRIRLAIDIGTNGEILLGNRERLLACSAAAGPAFEGAHVSSGMRGAEGAIDHVSFGETLEYSVIGDARPQGLCGSGLLDVVAGLIELGIITRKGKILAAYEVNTPQADPFLPNIVRFAGANAFLLVPESLTAQGRPILLTQEDIVSLQLAKGAIATGIQVLLETYGIDVREVEEVLLAGAFGNYMAPSSACIVGLIPRELEKKIRTVGNAAGTGAKAALLSRRKLKHSQFISTFVEYVELSSYEGFSRLFTRSLRFS